MNTTDRFKLFLTYVCAMIGGIFIGAGHWMFLVLLFAPGLYVLECVLKPLQEWATKRLKED
jgi:hypothetical protein